MVIKKIRSIFLHDVQYKKNVIKELIPLSVGSFDSLIIFSSVQQEMRVNKGTCVFIERHLCIKYKVILELNKFICLI